MKLQVQPEILHNTIFLPTERSFAKDQCSVVDLFCGVGGITHGFVLEGFKVLAGLDSDGSCKYAYEHNNNANFIHAKIEDVKPGEISALYPTGHVKILVGCAPCQPFSSYTNTNTNKDEKWKLVESFVDVIEAVKPDIVSMENVPNLRSFKKGNVFNEFIRRLSKDYFVTWHIVYCPEFGIPQMRRRLVVLASKFGYMDLIKGNFTSETYRTVRDAIGCLEPIAAGAASPNDPLHKARDLSEMNMRRIMQSVPGGSWKDWDEELIASCHKKESGDSYRSVYGRMSWDEPAPTITGQFFAYGSGRFGHPQQNRALSLREGALLQTFPPNYEFVAPGDECSFERVGTHIGNAVPVELGRIIAKTIAVHLGV